jgi:hypothetical protein
LRPRDDEALVIQQPLRLVARASRSVEELHYIDQHRSFGSFLHRLVSPKDKNG